MQTLKFLSFLCSVGLVFGEVRVYVNPQQYFNNTDNFANRIIYFFIEKKSDQSVCLQIQPPPFYPSDYTFLTQGIAYIDSKKVVQNYTADEVATLGEVEITFTVEAIPNKSSLSGYALFGQIFEWNLSLNLTSPFYYDLQSANLSVGNGIEILNTTKINPANRFLIFYSNILNANYWVSGNLGVFFSNSLTTNSLVIEPKPNTATSTDVTITLDLSKIQAVAVGVYSMYFTFQMVAIQPSTTFLNVTNDLSNVQVTQINYLTNSILSINGYLQDKNDLYQISTIDKIILRNNKKLLLDQYTATLAAMKVQWDNFAALPGLTRSEKSLIRQMQAFILAAQINTAKLTFD